MLGRLKDCLRKRDLDVKQGRRMEHDRSKWWGFVVNQQDLRVVIGCFVKACKKKGSGKESR